LHDEAAGLTTSLTAGGSSIAVINGTFSIPDGTNVLLMSQNIEAYSAAELTMIYDWFNAKDARLLWVAADSDYNGLFTPDALNGILAKVGSQLRIGAESVNDPVSNDDAAYRVVANQPVSDGDRNAIFTEGVSKIIMHGPAPVVAVNDAGATVNPEGLDDVEIIMKSSADAVASDSDVSDTQFDFYETNSVVGNYPMIAFEDMDDTHYVIVSGEAVFSDYKFMYSSVTENNGTQDGQKLVDNILSWFGGDGQKGGFLPVSTLPIFLGIATIAIIKRKK